MWNAFGDLLPQNLQKAGIKQAITDAMICEEFQTVAQHILGTASEKCHAVYIKDRALWVAVLSSAVSNELKLYEQDILKALAESCGPHAVAQLKFLS